MNPKTHASSSDPTYPPRAQAKSVTILHSGKVVDDDVGVEYTESEHDCIISRASDERHDQREGKSETPEKEIGESSTHSHRVGKQPAIESDRQREPDPEKVAPFPSALEKLASAEDNRTKKILEHLKDLKVNLPLIYAIQSIPSYSKFFKDLCTRKRNNSKVPQRVKLSEKVHSIFTSGLPPKLSDAGAFTLPCRIGKHKIDHALLDLGASVNLIPYSVYE